MNRAAKRLLSAVSEQIRGSQRKTCICALRRQNRSISLQRSILDSSLSGRETGRSDGPHSASVTQQSIARPSPNVAASIGSSTLHDADRTSSNFQLQKQYLLEDLKAQRAIERDIDVYFQDLLEAKNFTEVLASWSEWKDILKSGTRDARLADTRTVVLIAHVCSSQAESLPYDVSSVKELLLPMRPPKDASKAQTAAQKIDLSPETVEEIGSLILACEEQAMQPNSPGFLGGLKNLVIKYNGDALHQLYVRAQKSDVPLSQESYNRFAEGFLTIGRPQHAREVLQDMEAAKIERLPSLWANLLGQIGRSRDLRSIEGMWKDIQSQIVPDTAIYTALIDAYFKCGEVDRAFEALRSMSRLPASLPNSITCNVVVKGLVENDKLTEAIRFVQDSAVPAGMKTDVTTCNTLLKACLKAGTQAQLQIVMNLLKTMDARDVATYTILASRYSIDDMPVGKYKEKVEAVLAQMSREKIQPNAYFYSTIMNNLLFSKRDRNNIPARDSYMQAQIWLQDMKRANIPRTIIIYEVLLRALLRSSSFDSAFELWNDMRRDRVLPDSGAYHTMIRGLTVAGNLPGAIKVLKKSLDSQIRRDTTLLVVLNAAIARLDKASIDSVFTVLQQSGWTQHSVNVQQALHEAAGISGRAMPF